MIRMRQLCLLVSMFAVALALTSCSDNAHLLPSAPPTLQAITVTPVTSSLSHGQTQQFAATGQYTDGSSKPLTDVAWSSSDTAVAAITPAGLGSGVSVGTATITATSGTVTGNTTITVLPNASALVDATGGTLTVAVPESPINGLKLVIPPGAVAPGDQVKVSIDYADTLPGALDTSAAAASKVVVLDKDNDYNFYVPVTITMAADAAAFGTDDVPVAMYWSPTYGKYRATSVDAIDRTAHTVSFSTTHFSKYVITRVPSIGKNAPGASIDTGFRPDVDGFFHPNFGSYDKPGGSCLGMTLFSAWYYSNKKAVDTNGLFSKYREGDANVWQDDATARELISRAFVSSSSVWNEMSNSALKQLPSDTAMSLWSALSQTKEPQPLMLRGTNWTHYVLAYGWDSTTQQFLIYDNNFPGESVTLGWDATNGFVNYTKAGAYPNAISQVSFHGFGLAMEGKEFEDFYKGSEDGWSEMKFGTVTLTNPVPGANHVVDTTLDTNVAIEGTVTGGTKTPTHVVIFLDGVKLGSVPIANGGFNFTIPTLTHATSKLMLIATNRPKDPWDAFGGYGEYTLRILGRTFVANAGFETGDFTSWTHETHTWYDTTPGSFTPEKSAIANVGTDLIDTSLQQVYTGLHSARVNNDDWDGHISTVSQTVSVPNVPNPQMRFYWAAVLEDPNHDPIDQPYVDILVTDDTAEAEVYHRHFFSNDPAYSGWRLIPTDYSQWQVISWQPVMIDLTAAKGHTVTIKVTGADCALGGHGGYVYFDGDEN